MAGPHRDAADHDRPAAAQHLRAEVVAAGARARHQQDQVALRCGALDRLGEPVRIVGKDRPAQRPEAGFARLGLEHERVRVGELALGQLGARRAELVAGRQNR